MFDMLNAQVQLTSEMWYAGRGDEVSPLDNPGPEPSPESESLEWHSSVFALGRDAETRAGKPRNIIAIITTVHTPHCAEPGPGQCSSQFLLFVSV